MALHIYNTLTRKKELFEPLHAGHVGMYVCGPTVYGHSHIGHAKSYVSFDVIVRYLRYSGYKVTYVQNITDVGHLLGEANEGEDRMIRQSRLEHKHPMEVAEEYTRSYFEDMDALGVVRPDISPRASGHIIEQIELVKALMSKGFGYEKNGSVYFDVSKDKDYGKLSGRSVEEAEAGTRVEVKGEKRHPNDFALWKRAEPEHIMRWPSPWGVGFPGWHAECSAMSMKYLGETFDIHGGGMDNQFPHHECEIAQSEKVTGKQFVRYWIHNNLVTAEGQKMSKSLGNVLLLKDAFKQYAPVVIRFFILQSHYRGTLDVSEDALRGATAGLERLQNTVNKFRLQLEAARRLQAFGQMNHMNSLAERRQRLREAMDDDFNTPRAIAELFELCTDINNWLEPSAFPTEVSMKEIDAILHEYGMQVLGILSESAGTTDQSGQLSPSELIDLMIELRQKARQQKQWQMADQIRDGLKELGVELEDGKEGTTWRRSR